MLGGQARCAPAAAPRASACIRRCPGLPHFAAEGEGAHLPAHERRAVADRPVGLQAEAARATSTRTCPTAIRNGQRHHHDDQRPGAVSGRAVEVQVRAARPVRPWVSELLPHTAKIVDDIALVKTVHTNAINHDPACTFVMTGSEVPGKPSLGSWLAYGLGSENNDLPAFVVFTPNFPDVAATARRSSRACGAAASCRRKYNGVALRGVGRSGAVRAEPARRRRAATAARCSTRSASSTSAASSASAIPRSRRASRSTRWRSACRRSVPELIDLSQRAAGDARPVRPGREEARHVRRTARCSRGGWSSAACASCRSCTAAGTSTATCPTQLGNQCQDTDQATAALVTDLKQRGLLDRHARRLGRRVRPHGLLAGHADQGRLRPRPPSAQLLHVAGRRRHQGRHQSTARPTTSATTSSNDPVHVNDLNATILHCLGIDHERFTFKFQGLDQRLTGVEPARW